MDQEFDQDGVVEAKPQPLPISYRTIFESLERTFPDHALLILRSINKLILITEETPMFSTIGITRDGTIIISQKFWEENITSEEVLDTVITHEMMHSISGDIYTLVTKEEADDWQLQNMANNIAMDARINAYICNAHPEIYPEEFFGNFYNQEVLKQNPIHNLVTPTGKFVEEDMAQFKEHHDEFYQTEEFCSHHDLYKKVYDYLKKHSPPGKTLKVKLIGSHGDQGQEIDEKDLEGVTHIEIDASGLEDLKEQEGASDTEGDLEADIKEAALDKVSQESSMRAGRGAKSANSIIKLNESVTEKFDLNKFKKMMFDNIFHNVRSQAMVRTGAYSSSPIIPRKPSTSDIVLMACGYTPVLWKTRKFTSRFDNNLLPIYLDVSGSTWHYLPEIIKLITNVSNQIEFVWGFSNKIAKHTTKDLEEGKINSTGGTDFDCIIDHALENKFKHIVVISDGYAWTRREGSRYSTSNFADKIEGIDSVVSVLFGRPNMNNYFTRAYKNTHMIDEVKI